VIDFSDPSQPTEIGFYDTPEYALDIVVSGDLAYVANGSAGLRVIEVSDPSQPAEVGFYVTPDDAKGIAVSGDLVYVACSTSGLLVIDISDPSQPTEVGFCDTLGDVVNVDLSSGFAYVADHDSGLRVIDISNPSQPTEVGFCNVTPDYAYDVAVAEGLVYMTGLQGLSVIDISDPSIPIEVGFCDTPHKAWGVFASGDLVYVADGRTGLLVIRYDGNSSLKDEMTLCPVTIHLYQNYPNPFNPQTTISYFLPSAGEISLRIYDLPGRLVEVLFNGWQWAGYHEMIFDSRDLSSGLYMYELATSQQRICKKMLMMK